MVHSQWQEVPPRYACTQNPFDTRDYGYLNAIRPRTMICPHPYRRSADTPDRRAFNMPNRHGQGEHILGFFARPPTRYISAIHPHHGEEHLSVTIEYFSFYETV
jgi:hypothetical protein